MDHDNLYIWEYNTLQGGTYQVVAPDRETATGKAEMEARYKYNETLSVSSVWKTRENCGYCYSAGFTMDDNDEPLPNTNYGIDGL